MKPGKLLQALSLCLGASFLTIALVVALAAPAGAQVASPSLAIDVSPGDNAATQPGEIENCIEVPAGYEFDVDLIIRDVEELLAWEIYVEYDVEIMEVLAVNVDMFLAANAGSSVFDVSEALPDDDGTLRLAAADTSDPPTPDSGSGTLARLSLRALAAGESRLDFARTDIDNDSRLDYAPLLRNVSLGIVGDTNGDTFFDGPAEGAVVAVETSCPPGPGSVAAPGGSGSGNTWVFVAAGAGFLAIAAAAAGIFLFRRNGSSPMRPTPRA